MATGSALDRDLTPRDVQQLAHADAIAALFNALGYDTSSRLQQTPAAMGITAESLQRKVRRVERIADQEHGALQVYLVELDSVTVAATHGLVRALRDRAGNYLLVLTSDYEKLDFVLLERELPRSPSSSLSTLRVGVRPRVLTVARRNAGRVELRVLRRFTYTEADAEAQYDKLLSAYAVADWSEPNFNNRALFADYFLNERLPNLPEWAEDPKPAYLRLRELYTSVRERFGGADEAVVRSQVIEPTLKALGFTWTAAESGVEAPDYVLSSGGDGPSAVACLAYTWGRYLDGKDEQRDRRRAAENPGARVVSILGTGVAPWAIVTNGKVWRLYSAAAHSKATSYYELDLEETLALGDPGEGFRYFWLLFRAAAFRSRKVTIEGEPRELSFVDQLARESAEYAKRLGERLKDRVFEEVFPELAKGFIDHMRHVDGASADLPQERLDEVFRGTLALLYRLLFLLYAEARDLLPAREVHGYWEKSLSRLKREVALAAGSIKDEVRGHVAGAYSADPSATQLYDHLLELARIVDGGSATVNTPVYNGGLFLTEVETDDHTPEAEAARFLLKYRVPDRLLALALDRLARDVDEKRGDLVPIDYKSLGVRQLGSIYEGLLEFRVRIAPEKMAIVKGKKTEEIVPYREALKEKRIILTEGRGRNAKERTLSKGAVYLENDRRERKATGSYYTPDHIVKYIVERAVGPTLQEHLEWLRPKLRQAQQAYREAQRRQAGFQKRGMEGDEPEKIANDARWRALVDELFEFRVLDPAMGSGHFLVEAVDFITDRMLDFLNAFPWNPVQAQLRQTRETILAGMDRQGVTIDPGKLTDVNLLKRHVLKRCVYGVDLNPMAVELAKVSLWLDCFTLGAPLSFLDHHLKRGNSLIGATVQSVERDLATQAKGHVGDLFAGPFQGLLTATTLIEELAGLPDTTAEQSQRSHGLFAQFEAEQAPYKSMLNLWVSRHFGNKRAHEYLTLMGADHVQYVRSGGTSHSIGPEYQQAIQVAARLQAEKSFFHWDLEFPEAFVDLDRKQWKPTPEQGFHAVIGNPPYDVLASEELGYDVSADLAYFEKTPLYQPAIHGKKNLYKLFICRGATLVHAGGGFSYIVPMPLLGDDQAVGVRKMLLEQTGLTAVEAFPQKDDPKRRVFPEAKLATTIFVARNREPDAPFRVRTHPGRMVEAASPVLELHPCDVVLFDPQNAPIPSCTQRDWNIAVSIVSRETVKRLSDYCTASQGEVNETTDGKRGFIASKPSGWPLILRGSMIGLYVLREASQGEPIYLRKERYLKGKSHSVKTRHHEQARVGWQESSPQNNFRRIIAARIPKGEFCNHVINYIPEADSRLPLDFVLALLNSQLLDWFFRLSSTNAHVSHYQIYKLPAPTVEADGKANRWSEHLAAQRWAEVAEGLCEACPQPGVMPQTVVDALSEMSRRIQEIERGRTLANRSARSALDTTSQPIQDAIDRVLFHCYGLSEDDAEYIRRRLEEML